MFRLCCEAAQNTLTRKKGGSPMAAAKKAVSKKTTKTTTKAKAKAKKK
jgi:hypothetical protein